MAGKIHHLFVLKMEQGGSGRLLGMCKTFLILPKGQNHHRESHRVFAKKLVKIHR
jgi:hypothetical protein